MAKISIVEEDHNKYEISCIMTASYSNGRYISQAIVKQILVKELICGADIIKFEFDSCFHNQIIVTWESETDDYRENSNVADLIQDEISGLCYNYAMFTIFSNVNL